MRKAHTLAGGHGTYSSSLSERVDNLGVRITLITRLGEYAQCPIGTRATLVDILQL
jgi:hypothetical protein